ncbi:Transcription elongation factor GreB [wastewater metagenome]|uniref:Transcription elongation factor GreA n=2 Tax=unclassified sequences TaxID=12908 RepID=A0A5B8RB75_9ZZZZ|nr:MULTISPECIES: transcription elongation factor GreB [Arhodomonas]MCS4503061.1 transcription elongation factor GreB [Arhodomonas aquaeolei]QEA06050.1 transcription elongation factor GreB [uncultured organism]
MGRYRPPRPRSSPYITPEGWDRLNAELDWLWRERRPEVTQAVSEAAAMGDRSENAEYIYGKKQLREIDRRIRYLSKRLDALTVVRERPADRDRVFFGVWLEVEDEAGDPACFRIVGADEIDPAHGWISVDSPFARAALGKAVDEEFVVPTPHGETVYIVTAVHHEPPA